MALTASNIGQKVRFAKCSASAISSGESTGSLSSTAEISFILTCVSSGSSAISKIIPWRF